ncbi:hypothetical protein cypCar_00017880 [Cyprinus carpio]|nr:hypothetical protein cypCar_00017880 [Cyprinus carpio]
MLCNRGDDTFKGQPFFLRSAEDYRESLQSVPRADFGLSGKGHSWAVQTVDHQTDQHLEWPLQAPLDKVPLGWAGRRGHLVSGIRLAGSLEETKKERERCPLLVPSRGGENCWVWLPHQRMAWRALDRLTDAEGNRTHSPESSTW